MKDVELKVSDGILSVMKKPEGTLKKKSRSDNKKINEKEWIEVIPHGLVGGMIPNLCLMVFKEREGSKRFAISLSRLQGQISVHQSMNREEPFRFVSELLNAVKVRIEKCYFLKCQRGIISVQVIVSGHPSIHSMDLKADDVIPFAVYTGCRFYCTDQFIMEMLDQKMEQPVEKRCYEKTSLPKLEFFYHSSTETGLFYFLLSIYPDI